MHFFTFLFHCFFSMFAFLKFFFVALFSFLLISFSFLSLSLSNLVVFDVSFDSYSGDIRNVTLDVFPHAFIFLTNDALVTCVHCLPTPSLFYTIFIWILKCTHKACFKQYSTEIGEAVVLHFDG